MSNDRGNRVVQAGGGMVSDYDRYAGSRDGAGIYCVVAAVNSVAVEISLLRKQLEKLDRTVEKLNSDPSEIRLTTKGE